LGLPPAPEQGGDLGQVPPNLDQTFSAVLEAQADLIQSAAQLGVVHSFDQSPKQMLGEFEKQGDIDRIFAKITAAWLRPSNRPKPSLRLPSVNWLKPN
jgi:membrane fusion protein (multidrug efflux system)